MNNKITFPLIWKTIKNYLIFFLISIIAVPLCVHFAFEGLDSYSSKEQLNFAISCFAYHDDSLSFKDDLKDHMSSYGVKEVNFSYMECDTDSDTYSNLTDWFSTYAVYDADIFITDYVVADSLASTCSIYFTEEEMKDLQSAVDFDLKFYSNDDGTFGILIHDMEDAEYNANFAYLNDWLLFKSDIEEFNFVLSANEMSEGTRESNIETLKYFLTYTTTQK